MASTEDQTEIQPDTVLGSSAVGGTAGGGTAVGGADGADADVGNAEQALFPVAAAPARTRARKSAARRASSAPTAPPAESVPPAQGVEAALVEAAPAESEPAEVPAAEAVAPRPARKRATRKKATPAPVVVAEPADPVQPPRGREPALGFPLRRPGRCRAGCRSGLRWMPWGRPLVTCGRRPHHGLASPRHHAARGWRRPRRGCGGTEVVSLRLGRLARDARHRLGAGDVLVGGQWIGHPHTIGS